jgi:hypothetical protein
LSDELQQVEFVRTDNVVQRLPRVALGVPVFYDMSWNPAEKTDLTGLKPVYEKVHIGHELLVVRDEEIGQLHMGRSCLDDGRAVVHDIVSTISPKEDGLLDASSRFLDCSFTDNTGEVGINRSLVPVYSPAFDGFVGELPGLCD